MRSILALLIVSKSTPKAGNYVVSTLKFLIDISTTHMALIRIYCLMRLENSAHLLKSLSSCMGNLNVCRVLIKRVNQNITDEMHSATTTISM